MLTIIIPGSLSLNSDLDREFGFGFKRRFFMTKDWNFVGQKNFNTSIFNA